MYKFTPQPYKGERINWSHPLNQGLVFAVMGKTDNTSTYRNPPYELVRGVACLRGSTNNKGISVHDDVAGTAIPLQSVISPAITIESWVYPKLLSNAYTSVVSCEVVNISGWTQLIKSNGKVAAYFSYPSAGNANIDGTGAKTVPVNDWTHIVSVHEPGKYVQNYINGEWDGQGSSTCSATAYSNATEPANAVSFHLGDSPYSGRVLSGYLGIVKKWNAALTPQQIYWLYREPYAFIEQKIVRRYFIPSAVTFKSAWAARANKVIQPGISA